MNDRHLQWLLVGIVSVAAVMATFTIGVALDANLGTLGEWVGGLGTVSALGVSLYLLHQGQVDRRREEIERERQQARLVTHWVGIKAFDSDEYALADPPTGPCLYIKNGSDQAIFEVTIQPEPFDPDADTPGGLLGMIPPGETREAFWRDWPDRPSDVRALLNFVDANGVAWHRDGFRLTGESRKPDAIRLIGIDLVSPPVPMHRPQN